MATKLPPQPIGVAPGHSYWNDWYEKLRTLVEAATTVVVRYLDLNFTGSNLSSIETREHDDLQLLQGGDGATEYYHLTSAQHTALTAGFTGTGTLVRSSVLGITVVVPLAKLTLAGTNGSLTFTNGILTARVDPT